MSETIAAQHCSVCAHLRAEVKRLQYINAELLKQKDGVDKDLFGVVCFERDEALAQVAVLMQTCEELADRIIALDASARILIPQGLPKARALLDRLQRAEEHHKDCGVKCEFCKQIESHLRLAEAVVEAARDLLSGHAPIHWYVNVNPLAAALAAWEEGNI